jgi:hypothetical protein
MFANSLTLREAASRVLAVGGQISRGEYGELQISLPASIVRRDAEMMTAAIEQESRRGAAAAADVLVCGHRVAFACIAEVEFADGKLEGRRGSSSSHPTGE